MEKVNVESSAEAKSSADYAFGMLEILVGDGQTGISIYTVGGGKKASDPDMSTGLVFALEQSVREHAGTAKDVFFGGINSSGGIGWCVKEYEVAGEIREFYIGAALIPGSSYSLDIDTLEQKNKGKKEFFVFLKDYLMSSIVKHLNYRIAELENSGKEANLDAILRTGASAFRYGELNQIVKSPDDLGDSWRVFSEACTQALKEQGTILRALSADDKGLVESKHICSEMISEYLDEVYEAQNIKLEEAEFSIQKILGPLRSNVDMNLESWPKHISLTASESLFRLNPSCLLLLGEQRSYFNLFDSTLKEKLREWGTKRKDFFVRMKYGSEFLYSVGAKFESMSFEEISQRKEEILDFLAVSMVDKIYEAFPLTALTYDSKKKAGLKNEMLEIINEVIPAVEQEIIEGLFVKIIDEVFSMDKFAKDVFSKQKTETLRRKMDEWINKLYTTLQERLYQINIVFSIFTEPLEQFRMRIADFINERAVSSLKGDAASAIMLALKHLEPEIKDPASIVYLSFIRELVKGFVGKEMTSIYPTLGYLLKESKILDKLDDAFKVILKDTGFENVKILENVSSEIKRISEKEIALTCNVERADKAKRILQEAIRKMLLGKDGFGGIFLGDEVRIPIPAVELYKNYQKIIGEINYAWTTFNLIEALEKEMQNSTVIRSKALGNEVVKIYNELISDLGSIKKSQDPKESKKTLSRLEKLEKKLDVEKNSFDSINKLKKYVEQRKDWVWNKITGEEPKKATYYFSETIANFRLIPPVRVILGMGIEDAYQSICNIIKNERETMQAIIEFIRVEKPEIDDQLEELGNQLEVFRELVQKLENIAKNHKKFEKILETPRPLFQEERVILEEICQEFSFDPFFKSTSDVMETYVALAFWENDEIPAVKRLVNDFVKQSFGKKIPSKTMVDELKETLKESDEQIDIESASKKILDDYIAKFNLFWQVQMMSVELAILAPDVWKKYKNMNDRSNEYEDMKLDINNIDNDLPKFALEDRVPVMELGTISKTFFGDKINLIAECFGEDAPFKFIEKENDNVVAKLVFPWLEKLNPSSTTLRSLVRAYIWKILFEEQKGKYDAYQKILGLYGLETEEEFKRFLDYLREVIREGK
ncbi:MAG: hypothetical protein WED07_12630 [Candidatus Freyarchaeum deiterrae]